MSQACLDWATSWVDRWAAREGDTPREKLAKRIFTVSFCVTVLLGAIMSLTATERGSTVGQCSAVATVVLCVGAVLYLRAVRRASGRFVVSSAMLLSAFVVTDVVFTAELGLRSWTSAIVMLDILLVIQAPETVTATVVVVMCTYITFIGAEQWLRFGLSDLPGLAPYENRFCYEGCAKPPCSRSASVSVNIVAANIGTFLLDFYFTRGFALQVRREKDKIAAAVTTAEQVAERLASLDLDAAEAVLQGSEDVPPGLCESLYTILSHLKGYKPFLPQAVMLPAYMTLTDEEMPADDFRFSSESQSPSSISHSSVASKNILEASTFHLVVKPVSLLHLHPSLPVVSDTTFLASHSQVLEAVLKQAVSCQGCGGPLLRRCCEPVVQRNSSVCTPPDDGRLQRRCV